MFKRKHVDVQCTVDSSSAGVAGGEDDEDEDPQAEAGETSGRDNYGVYNASMRSFLINELKTLRRCSRKAFNAIMKAGVLRVLLAMDNTSRPLFDGSSSKVEQGAAKLFIPGAPSSQQSPYMASPLFLVEGACPLVTAIM